MKRIGKYLILTALVLALMLAVCACGSKGVSKPAADEGAKTYEIKGSVTAEKLNDATLRVHCNINLEPGTILAISIDSHEGEELKKQKFTMTENQSFYADFEIGEWEKPVYASLTVTPESEGKQPDEVKTKYGAKLQNVTGDCVYFNTQGNFICIQSEAVNEF